MKRVDGAVLTGLMCSFISVKKGGKATVRNKIVTLSSLFLLFSIAVFGQEHRARVIDYISCDNDIPGVKETDGRVVNRKWEATFNGEIGFHHVRGNDQTEDKDHDSDRLRYLTYDGACFEARW